MEKRNISKSEQYSFDKIAFLESFVQYRMTPEAESDFRIYAKRGSKADKDIIEKNLSVLIHTTDLKTPLPHNKCRYQFEDFVILTSEDTQTMDVLYWVNKKNKVTKKMSYDLKNKFNTIGLDHTGFASLSDDFESDISPEAL